MGDGGRVDGGPGLACEPDNGVVIEPVWMAGTAGPAADVGAFGRPDAIFIDGHILLAGDEEDAYHEIHLYDLDSDDPTARADQLTPLGDIGGPGTGPMQFQGVAGFARHAASGNIYVVEHLNSRVQILRPAADPALPPHYEHDSFLGGRASDTINPADGLFFTPQAARTDSLGRLYVTDDAKGDYGPDARKDVQVFSAAGDFLSRFGDASQGALGEEGNLAEPENFVIDEGRDRLYVCDENPKNVVVYRFSDRTFITRMATDLLGTPNGIDIDQYGFIYLVDEGNALTSTVRVYEPEGLTEVFHFGELSTADDPTPGFFNSPDTLIVDVDRDLLIVADQGHDRIQGFRLSEIQEAGCLRAMTLSVPTRMIAGRGVTARVELLRWDGLFDWRTWHLTGRVQAQRPDGTSVPVTPDTMDVDNGVGTLTLNIADPGEVMLTVEVDGLTRSRPVEVLEAPPTRDLTGTLTAADLDWSREDGVVHLSGETTVPGGETLHIGAGTLVMLDGGAGLEVLGSLLAEGTDAEPIYIFPSDAAAPWAHIRHPAGGSGIYRNVFLTGASSDTWDWEGLLHCCSPAVHASGGGTFEFTRSVFADMPATKGLLAREVDGLTVRQCIFHRMGFGFETVLDEGATGVIDSVHVRSMRGPDDNDGFYVWGYGEIDVTRSVFSDVDDDCVDTRFSDVRFRDSLFYDCADKGASLSRGGVQLDNCLFLGSRIGIKVDDGPASPIVRQSTMFGNAEDGFFNSMTDTADVSELTPTLERVIVWGNPVAIHNSYMDFSYITVNDSDLSDLPPTSGMGNISEDPLFFDTAARDFRIRPYSPVRMVESAGGPLGFAGF